MRRGKRDYDHRSHNNGHSNNAPARKRTRHSQYGNQQDVSSCQNLIASESSIPGDEQTLDLSLKLSELKSQRQRAPNWPWDKAPPGCESLSVRALKLFGVATPNGEFSVKQLPDEVLQMKRAKPLTPENSWVFRKVGDTITQDLIKASLSAGSQRPSNLPSFGPLLTNSDSIVVRDAPNIQNVVERYGPVSSFQQLDSSTFAVILEKPKPPINDDCYLLPRKKSPQVVEILNAVPLRISAVNDAVSVVESLCEGLDEPVRRVWKKEPSSDCPFTLTRVFVELENHEHTYKVAELLGQKSVQGRKLITTINSSPEIFMD